MEKIIIHTEVDYSKISNPLAKNSFRRFKSTKIEDKRFKKPRYKKDYLDD